MKRKPSFSCESACAEAMFWDLPDIYVIIGASTGESHDFASTFSWEASKIQLPEKCLQLGWLVGVPHEFDCVLLFVLLETMLV